MILYYQEHVELVEQELHQQAIVEITMLLNLIIQLVSVLIVCCGMLQIIFVNAHYFKDKYKYLMVLVILVESVQTIQVKEHIKAFRNVIVKPTMSGVLHHIVALLVVLEVMKLKSENPVENVVKELMKVRMTEL